MAALTAYETGPEAARHEVREIFREHSRFAGFRRRLLRISAVDQGLDYRDENTTL